MTLNFWDSQDVQFKRDDDLPLQSKESIEQQIAVPPRPTFDGFAIGTNERDVSLGDTISAQLGYTYAPITEYINNAFTFTEEQRDPNYDPFQDMEGFEDMNDYLKDAVNAEHMSVLKKQLLANERRRKILGYSSFGSQLVAGIFDPINLVTIPFGGFTISAARAALRTGAGVTVLTAGQEALRYPTDPLATGGEVAANLGMSFVGGAVLGGLIGGIASRKITKALDELEADEKFFQDIAEPLKKAEESVADQFKGKTKSKSKKTKTPLIRTEKDLQREDIKDVIQEADETILVGFRKNLPLAIQRLEKELVKLQEDTKYRFPVELKSLREQKLKLEKELLDDTKQVGVLVETNNKLNAKIENIAKLVNQIKGARDKFAAPLKKIKDDIEAQAKGQRKTIGITKKQQALLESIKSKEANQFFTPSQKKAVTNSLNAIKKIQQSLDKNINLLQTKRQGNVKFLGDQGRKLLRQRIDGLNEIIKHNNKILAVQGDIRAKAKDYENVTAELNRREVNEFATFDAEGKRVDGFRLPANIYTDSFIYKALVTPIKKTFQSKIIPEITKNKFFKLASDMGMNLVANKLGKTFGQSVHTKSAVRQGEYVQAHDQLRSLYAKHTGKNQVYIDVDLQKKGYHQWLESTYKRILEGKRLSPLDKEVKSVVNEFMQRWEARLRDVGIIGDEANIQRSIVSKSQRLIEYTRKLNNIVQKAATEQQSNIANVLVQDAVNILRGIRKQDKYIPIRRLSKEQFIERFFNDAKIDRFITDQAEAEKVMKSFGKDPDLVNGVHCYFFQPRGKGGTATDGGMVIINEKNIRSTYNFFLKYKDDPEGLQAYLNQLVPERSTVRRPEGGEIFFREAKNVRVKDTIAGQHVIHAQKNKQHFESFDDFYDYIVYHELSHGKFPQKRGESKASLEKRIDDEAIKRLLQEKDSFNPATQGMVLSRKNIETDLPILENMAGTKFLTKGEQNYKNNVAIPEIKRLNNELIELRKTLKDTQDNKIKPSDAEDFFPRYFDKEAIKKNRAKFESILREWYTNNPTILVKNKDGTVERVPPQTQDEVIKATAPENINARVKDTVDNILGRGRDVTDDAMAFYGHGKSKHFRHRNLDIPNKLVTDFIITNPVQVMRVYTQRVAPKYEFAKAYGNRSIDEVITDMSADNYAAGMSERQVNEVNKDFLHLYDRVVGNVIKNPDRLDQKAVIVLRDLAQLNYLGSSGFSTLPDFAKILMEHDLGNVLKGLVGVLQDSRVRMNAREGRLAGEILEILQGDVHMRFVEDLTNNPLAQGYQETMSKVRNVFYLLNGLAPMTNLMKKLDATIRTHELIQFSIKEAKGTATKNDIVYLRRYGLDKNKSLTISKLYDDGIIQNTKAEGGQGLYLANTEKWLEGGASEETLDAFRGALNNGIMNTILMATPADKPIIADGVVYIPKWIGEKFGMKEDVRFKGYTRIETGLAGLPFQFWSYSFAAANKITAAMATGQAKNRTAAVTTAVALGWLSLQIKSEFNTAGGEAMWDNMAWEDQLARSIDSSGILAMYSDLLYTGMNTSMALGGPDISMGLLQPKFPQEKNITDAITSIGGAGPSIGVELGRGVVDMLEGNYGEGSKQIIKNLPYMRLWFIKDMVNELGNVLVDIDDDGLEKTLRARY